MHQATTTQDFPEIATPDSSFEHSELAATVLATQSQDFGHLSHVHRQTTKPVLWSCYNGKMTRSWKNKVLESSKDRVAESQTRDNQAKGQHKALAPKGWA